MSLRSSGLRSLPEVKWGLIPAGGGCRKLPKLIGMVRAKEMIFTAKPITAQEAERIGIVNRIVAAENAMAEALDLARQVLANVQVAVRGAKRSIDYALDYERTIAYDLEVANLCYAAKERKQGISSFANRKSAQSQGEI